MGTITAIKPQRRPGRYNIMVDGAFAIAVSEKVLVDLQLAVGLDLDDQSLTETALAEEKHKALASSLRLLESRDRSQREIENRLKEHGYNAATIQTVTAKLTDYGLINDSQFAAAWVESRSRSKPAGVQRLKMELYQKGVAKEIIHEAVSEIDEDDELELARQAIGRRPLKIFTDPSDRQAEYQRQAAFLTRRGFKWEMIRAVLRERYGSPADDE